MLESCTMSCFKVMHTYNTGKYLSNYYKGGNRIGLMRHGFSAKQKLGAAERG
jgi:hypothetical protein